jgi:hypothetical protein
MVFLVECENLRAGASDRGADALIVSAKTSNGIHNQNKSEKV